MVDCVSGATVAGSCGKCGAPFTVPTMWFGITPPPATPTCMCWNVPQTDTSTETHFGPIRIKMTYGDSGSEG